MNAQLDAGKDVNEVFLHLSKGSSIVRLNEATLTLFINNRIAETPQALTPEEIFGPPENYPEDAIFVYVNPEKPDVPLNKNDAFQKVQKRRVQEKR